MKNCCRIIILLWSVKLLFSRLTSCVTARKNRMSSVTTEKLHKGNGEAIAVVHLIQKYEREHQQFYEQRTKYGEYSWLDLYKKNLSIYCRKYLQHSLPTRSNENASGTKITIELHYKEENTGTSSKVDSIQCKLMNKSHPRYYYITRAPQLNCVYALQHTRSGFQYNIINKYCDFEGKPLINGALKRKRVEIINKIHAHTGQPMARDEYLLEYELEHQAMLKKGKGNNIYIEWPNARMCQNLDSYCYHYIGACAPRRNLENVTGSWKNEKLQYQKLKTNYVTVVRIIICQLSTLSKRRYYITRAYETNCVYSLLRQGRNILSPLIIIFKHCDFEDPSDQTILKDYDNLHENIFPKTELKEETLDAIEMLQLFPTN